MKRSLVEVGFSLILFLMFVLGSFFLLYYGSNAYKNGIEKEEIREKDELPYAYIATKFRQAKSVSLDNVDGNNVLVFKEDNYQTIVYYKDGGLYELLITNDNSADLNGGIKIVNVDNFEVSYVDGYYEIKLNDTSFKVGK